MTSWVIILEAKASSLVPQITPAWLTRCAVACQIQLDRDVSAEWGGNFAVRVGSGPTDIASGEHVFALLDALPDAPGAIAYHDIDGNGAPVAYLALSTCSSLDDVSTAISHELCEAAGDPSCNAWVDDGAREHAYELCDAVESTSYGVDLGDGQAPIAVSDFLLRAWFDSTAPGPYTHQNAVAAPFTMAAGGYEIQRASGTGEAQVNALAGSKRGALAAAGKHSWSSRAARRGVKRA